MTEQTDRTLVQEYTARRLRWLQTLPEHAQKGALANLRRGVGRAPGDMPELWGAFLADLPQPLESRSLPADNMHRPGAAFGQAVRRLVKAGEQPQDSSILRRFNALATAANMRESAQHLRGIVQLLRAGDIPLDYVQLSADLYDLQFASGAQRVRLRWGQDFYRTDSTKEETGNEKENEV